MTLKGDIYDPAGILSGGFNDQRKTLESVANYKLWKKNADSVDHKVR